MYVYIRTFAFMCAFCARELTREHILFLNKQGEFGTNIRIDVHICIYIEYII